ncbi:MAG: hypothetical protein K2N90_09940, partial [Lachnospiraceae bacterium]|nr:hypothetical protein [Lachnospiraceae bacterium]
MGSKRYIQYIAAVLLWLFTLSGCGYSQEHENVLSSVEMQETDFGESEYREVSAKEEETTASEALQEMPTEENGLMEIYTSRDGISVSGDCMIAQVSPQERLTGNPTLYARCRI